MWVPLHDHRAGLDVREERGRDGCVIPEEIALRDAEVGPERLPQVRKTHQCAARLDFGVVGVRRNQRERLLTRRHYRGYNAAARRASGA